MQDQTPPPFPPQDPSQTPPPFPPQDPAFSSGQPLSPQQNPHQQLPQSQSNGLAIASLICAFFFPLIGLILGIVALTNIKKSGSTNGRGLALAGIIVSAVMMVLSIILSIWILSSMDDFIDTTTNGSSNVRNDRDRDNNGNNQANGSATPTPGTHRINQTITDPELGYVINVKNIIIDVPIDEDHWSAGSRIGIAVEVEIQNNSEFIGSFSPSATLRLVFGDGSDERPTNIPFRNHIDDNNITEISIGSVRRGDSLSGWLFFSVPNDTNLDGLTFRYMRREYQITQIGGDGGRTTIPAQNFDISLF